jgi:hypothetical protein
MPINLPEKPEDRSTRLLVGIIIGLLGIIVGLLTYHWFF